MSHHRHPGDKLSGHTLSYDYIGELLQLNRLLPYRVGGPFSCANADCIASVERQTATGEDRMYVREDHKDGDDSTPSGGVLAIWREAQKRFTRAQHIYSIVLIDEVHELKNPHTLATMLAVAAGLHAPRVISISGTGYQPPAGHGHAAPADRPVVDLRRPALLEGHDGVAGQGHRAASDRG